MKGKKLLTIALSAALVGSAAGMLAGCGEGKGTELVYWCFDADMAQQVTDYYDTEERALEYDVKVEVVPLESMLTRLDNGFRSGKNLPDVVALEAESFKKYIDDGATLLENLDDLKGLTSEMYDYTVEGATGDDGHLYALATNVTPGIFAYRRSMAKAAFGTDDPAEIQKHFDSWEHFLESAKTLSELRTEEYPEGIKVISSYMDIGKVFCGSRSEGWVDANGNLAIDASLTEGEYSMMEVAKQLHVNGYTGEQTSGDGGWYAGISDSDDDKIFGYFRRRGASTPTLPTTARAPRAPTLRAIGRSSKAPLPTLKAVPITPSSRARICSKRLRTSWNSSRPIRAISRIGRRSTATS